MLRAAFGFVQEFRGDLERDEVGRILSMFLFVVTPFWLAAMFLVGLILAIDGGRIGFLTVHLKPSSYLFAFAFFLVSFFLLRETIFGARLSHAETR